MKLKEFLFIFLIFIGFVFGAGFVVRAAAVKKSLTIDFPKANTQWLVGSNQTITWHSTGLSSKAKLSVYIVNYSYGSTAVRSLIGTVPATQNSITWKNVGSYHKNDKNDNYIKKFRVLVSDTTDNITALSGLFSMTLTSTTKPPANCVSSWQCNNWLPCNYLPNMRQWIQNRLCQDTANCSGNKYNVSQIQGCYYHEPAFTFPKAGMVLGFGQMYEVGWNYSATASQGHGDTIIFTLTDGFKELKLNESAKTPISFGKYYWNIPASGSNLFSGWDLSHVWLKSSHGSVSDVFSIGANPTVQAQQQNQTVPITLSWEKTLGIKLTQGQQYTITWTGADPEITYYKVYLVGGSLGKTGDYYFGRTDSGTHSFTFTVPQIYIGGGHTGVIPGSGFSLKFMGVKTDGCPIIGGGQVPTCYATGNNPDLTSFTIISSTGEGSGVEVKLSFPAIGQQSTTPVDVQRGKTISILWNRNAANYVNISASKGSRSWPIASHIYFNDNNYKYDAYYNIYKWTVPNDFPVGLKYDIVVSSETDSLKFAHSQQLFNVATAPGQTGQSGIIISPAQGDVWQVGSTQNITWDTSEISDTDTLSILFYWPDRNSITNIANGISASQGYYNWTIPAQIAGSSTIGQNFKIKLVAYPTAAEFGTSGNFSIVAQGQQQQAPVSFSSPRLGENWTAGDAHIISWSSPAGSGPYKIYLINAGDFTSTQIGTSQLNAYYNWTIPATITPGDYQIQVSTANGDVYSDIFSVVQQATSPYINVISPAGREKWAAGSQQTITWEAGGVPGANPVYIYLQSPNSSVSPQLLALANSSTTSITTAIPTIFPAGTYTIYIMAFSNQKQWLKAYSNSFDITAPATNNTTTTTTGGGTGTSSYINIFTPAGGEKWAMGSRQNISWQASDDISGTLTVTLYKLVYSSVQKLSVLGTANPGASSLWVTIPTSYLPGQYEIYVEGVNSQNIVIRGISKSFNIINATTGYQDILDSMAAFLANIAEQIKTLLVSK